MFELAAVIFFCWLLIGAIRLAFRVTWGLAKVVAAILFVFAIPILIVCLLFAGGLFILLPVALIGAAWCVLKAAV